MSNSKKSHRTLLLILVAWGGTVGLYASHPDWSAWAWVAVVLGGLSLWIGGKAVAATIAAKIPGGQ